MIWYPAIVDTAAAARDMRRSWEQNKHQMFRSMLQRALKAGLSAAYLVADAWFGCKENIALALESELIGIFQIMNDIGMLLVQFAGLRRVAVALFGDRERNDPRRRIGHACDQARGVFSRHLGLEHRADDAVFGAGAGTNGNRIEVVLRGEGIARVRTPQACADDAPIRCAAGKKVVDHHRLVGPVKRADSEMNDARPDPRAVVTGAVDLAGKAVEAGIGEAQIALYRVEIRDFRRLP